MANLEPSTPDPLRHPVRQRIMQILERRPGLAFLCLLEELRGEGFPRLVNGSLDWHLWVLQRAGQIVSIRSGRFRRYFPSRGPWARNLAPYALVRSPSAYRIARLLVQGPERTLAEIHAALPESERGDVDTLRAPLRRFVLLGLAEAGRRGAQKTYRPRAELVRIVGVLEAFRFPAPLALMQPGRPSIGDAPRPAAAPTAPGAAPATAPPTEA